MHVYTKTNAGGRERSRRKTSSTTTRAAFLICETMYRSHYRRHIDHHLIRTYLVYFYYIAEVYYNRNNCCCWVYRISSASQRQTKTIEVYGGKTANSANPSLYVHITRCVVCVIHFCFFPIYSQYTQAAAITDMAQKMARSTILFIEYTYIYMLPIYI